MDFFHVRPGAYRMPAGSCMRDRVTPSLELILLGRGDAGIFLHKEYGFPAHPDHTYNIYCRFLLILSNFYGA